MGGGTWPLGAPMKQSSEKKKSCKLLDDNCVMCVIFAAALLHAGFMI